MSKIDPKWIQFDDSVMTIVQSGGENQLTLKTDAVLSGVSVELINDVKFEVRLTSEGVPTEDLTRDMSKDFWIEVPG